MKIPYHLRPGAGFVLLAVVLLLSLAFFVWGLGTPPLEREWREQIERTAGGEKR